MHQHLPTYACLIYIIAFRVSIGLWWSLTSYPAIAPHMKFLFVRPVFCLRLPSDIPSQVCPCLQLMLPLTGCIEDFHLQVLAPCRAHKEKTGNRLPGLFHSKENFLHLYLDYLASKVKERICDGLVG
jgi:hypothetical protein